MSSVFCVRMLMFPLSCAYYYCILSSSSLLLHPQVRVYQYVISSRMPLLYISRVAEFFSGLQWNRGVSYQSDICIITLMRCVRLSILLRSQQKQLWARVPCGSLFVSYGSCEVSACMQRLEFSLFWVLQKIYNLHIGIILYAIREAFTDYWWW